MSNEHYTSLEINACSVGSAGGIIVGPIEVSHLHHLSVDCISSATMAVYYSIQFSPYESEGYATAGANFSSTSIAQASGADLVVSNRFENNHHAFMRIQASANSATTKGDLRFVVHGLRFN